MPSLNEKIAASLKNLVASGNGETLRVYKTDAISRTDRERLIKAGFLSEIIKGWVLTTRPGERKGDSTAWYSSFWSSPGSILTIVSEMSGLCRQRPRSCYMPKT